MDTSKTNDYIKTNSTYLKCVSFHKRKTKRTKKRRKQAIYNSISLHLSENFFTPIYKEKVEEILKGIISDNTLNDKGELFLTNPNERN